MTTTFADNPAIDNAVLNALFDAAWPRHVPTDFARQLARSLVYIAAYDNATLIGFVNVAWDGGVHTFLLDPTVHPAWRRRGIGRELVQRAATSAATHGAVWLHVDFAPGLRGFYAACGFRPTDAGLMRLTPGGR